MPLINIINLSQYAGINLGQNKYVEGHRVYSSQTNIFDCGLVDSNSTNYKINSMCLQTSHLKDGFFKIVGEIEPDGKIVNFKCTCPAGESGQCKHIIGTLFYCM